MLKNFGYDGTYYDENFSVSVLLDNPLECGFEAEKLVFNIAINTKKGGVPRLDDFTFYIMDEANNLYNVQCALYTKPVTEAELNDDEPVRWPDALIHTSFNYSFLFQDLRVAFYYRPYRKISIIELKH